MSNAALARRQKGAVLTINPITYFRRRAARKAREAALEALEVAFKRKDTRSQHHASREAVRATLEALRVGA